MKKKRTLFFLIPLLFFACTKEQDKVSWLKIEKWELLPNPNNNNNEGELTHNLNQVFISMGGKFLGSFELPIKIPIIDEGTHDFVLIPGVVQNGINSTKTRYPFMEQYSTTLTLKLEDTVTMQPTTRYFDNIQFLIEDFENPVALNIETDQNSLVDIIASDDPAISKWGNYFGRIDLTKQDSLFIGYTNFGVSLPKQNANVFLEMDYMNSNSLATSVISYNSNELFDDVHIQLNPQSNPHWRHIYLDLKEIITFRNQATVNEQGFVAILDSGNVDGFVYLDNIKVVYR